MVRVADIASHGQSQQLAHEVVFEPGADDLPFVVKIFRPDEAHDAVDQKGMECRRDRVGAGLKCQLINSVMCVRGKSAALSGFEVHGIVPDPSHIATAVVIENSFPTLAQHRESDSETTIGGFGSSHGLK